MLCVRCRLLCQNRHLLQHVKKAMVTKRMSSTFYPISRTTVPEISMWTTHKSFSSSSFRKSFLLRSNLFHDSATVQYFHASQSHYSADNESEFYEGSSDQVFKEVFEDYLLPSSGHRVYVIQPELQREKKLNRAQLRLDEACALVDSLPGWSVSNKDIFTTKIIHDKCIFGKGKFKDITEIVRRNQSITAVFVSINMLTATQLSALQHAWKLPVYDRYTVVLQIFRIRAKTAEAKIQVALAEIPYLRSRLYGMHSGKLDQQKGGMTHIGGAGETFLEIRHRLLQERELKGKRAIERIGAKRELLRKERTKREIPVVAVVGYTNAGLFILELPLYIDVYKPEGKTSLIKKLTGKKEMMPRDQLFATLDVTVHAGLLNNHLKVLYTDTVGFISDIPTDLIHSFSATLEDVKRADLIIHVRDISHPDREAQKLHVLKTLTELDVSTKLMSSIVEVCNKVDLVNNLSEEPANCLDLYSDDNGVLVSTITGEGLEELQNGVSKSLMKNTNRRIVKVTVPMTGQHITWLYKESTILNADADDTGKYLRMETLMTEAVHGKFLAKFGKGR